VDLQQVRSVNPQETMSELGKGISDEESLLSVRNLET
jgi:hypothetical protein